MIYDSLYLQTFVLVHIHNRAVLHFMYRIIALVKKSRQLGSKITKQNLRLFYRHFYYGEKILFVLYQQCVYMKTNLQTQHSTHAQFSSGHTVYQENQTIYAIFNNKGCTIKSQQTFGGKSLRAFYNRLYSIFGVFVYEGSAKCRVKNNCTNLATLVLHCNISMK